MSLISLGIWYFSAKYDEGFAMIFPTKECQYKYVTVITRYKANSTLVEIDEPYLLAIVGALQGETKHYSNSDMGLFSGTNWARLPIAIPNSLEIMNASLLDKLYKAIPSVTDTGTIDVAKGAINWKLKGNGFDFDSYSGTMYYSGDSLQYNLGYAALSQFPMDKIQEYWDSGSGYAENVKWIITFRLQVPRPEDIFGESRLNPIFGWWTNTEDDFWALCYTLRYDGGGDPEGIDLFWVVQEVPIGGDPITGLNPNYIYPGVNNLDSVYIPAEGYADITISMWDSITGGRGLDFIIDPYPKISGDPTSAREEWSTRSFPGVASVYPDALFDNAGTEFEGIPFPAFIVAGVPGVPMDSMYQIKNLTWTFKNQNS